MSSEWYEDWLHDWWLLWSFIWSHILGYIQAVLAGDEEDRRWHWTSLEYMSETLANQIVALMAHGIENVTFIWEEWANDLIAEFEAWLMNLLGIEVEPEAPFTEQLALLWGSIVALWARFGYEITRSDITVVGWVQNKLGLTDPEIADPFYTVKGWVQTRLHSVWGSIVAIWARFGPAFLEGDWTVISWVEDKATAVVQWVLDNYETARLQAEAAATWIAIHGQVITDWLTDNGQNLVDWYDSYATYYADLYDNYHNLLLEFLEDPGAFIGKYIDPIVVVPPGEEEPGWLLWLLGLILNPIGVLWAYLELSWAVPYAWLMNWLAENTPTAAMDEAAMRETDGLIPDLDEWMEGLFEPVTPAQVEYDANLELWATQIVDETLIEHPFQFPEVV